MGIGVVLQSVNVKERKNFRQESTDQGSPLGVDLTLPRTAGEAYNEVAAAWRDGRLSDARVRLACELLKVRAGCVAAEEFHARLQAAEAAHRASLDLQRQLAAPARRQTVTVESEPTSREG